MEVSIKMTEEEFLDFLEWKKDCTKYSCELDKAIKRTEMYVKKILWALGEDQKKPGKVKIIDHEHAAELVEWANDWYR